jgi:hypothetical protein
MAIAGRFAKTPDIVERTIADEVFLLPVRGDLATRMDLFALSEVGQFVWERIDGRRGFDDLLAEVVAAFAVSDEQARADVREFLDQLLDYRLISVLPE